MCNKNKICGIYMKLYIIWHKRQNKHKEEQKTSIRGVNQDRQQEIFPEIFLAILQVMRNVI